jgi:HEAT repeat protein
MRLDAALALAEAGEKASLPVLAEILADTPEGRDNWRSAAGGLMKAGDPSARKLLEGELAQPDAARSVGAAFLLARAGDARAKDQLALHMKDPEFARPGDAALALAWLGDKRALDWVGPGLDSPDSEERKLALGIAGALAAEAAAHAGAIAKLAGTEQNLGVCMTAEAVLLGL